MSDFYRLLKEETERLKKVIEDIERAAQKYNNDLVLEVHHCRGHRQFYIRKRYAMARGEQRTCVKYLKNKDITLAKELAQRDYDYKLLKQLRKRQQIVEKLIATYDMTNPEDIYSEMSADRQELVVPRMLSDENYAARWQSVEYKGKSFAEGVPEIYTARGERVRSKSEKILADTFERYGIPYRYEYPLEYPGEQVIYPDFHVLNKRLRKVYIFEHLGMMDDATYMKDALFKLESLQQHGIYPGKNLLLTFESKNKPLSTAVIERIIREYLL